MCPKVLILFPEFTTEAVMSSIFEATQGEYLRLPMSIKSDNFRHRPGTNFLPDGSELCTMCEDSVFKGVYFFSGPFPVSISSRLGFPLSECRS